MKLWDWFMVMMHRRGAQPFAVPELDQDSRLEAARQSDDEATRLLREVRLRRPTVTAHAAEMRRLQLDNGFAELITEALKGIPSDE